MIFTAELGTSDSAPGNIALGFTPSQTVTTVTSIGDSAEWVVTLSDTALGDIAITDSGDPG